MSDLHVRVSLASAEQAALLAEVRHEDTAALDLGVGPAPLLERRPPTAPNRPASYTAITAEDEDAVRPLPSGGRQAANGGDEHIAAPAPLEAIARGRAVHGLLEWSANRGWLEPPAEVVGRFAAAEGLSAEPAGVESLLDPLRAWLGCELFAERVRRADRSRAEVSISMPLAGTLLRGSIDLLVEQEGDPPLIVDYKTDHLGEQRPEERASHYQVQRDVYSLVVSEARHRGEVDVAYVFLERPERPVVTRLREAEIEAGRARLTEAIEQIRSAPEGGQPASGSSFAASSSKRSSLSPSPTASSSAEQ